VALWDGKSLIFDGVRDKIPALAKGKVAPSDIPKGFELFIQSTSPNRKLDDDFVVVADAKRGTKTKAADKSGDDSEEKRPSKQRKVGKNDPKLQRFLQATRRKSYSHEDKDYIVLYVDFKLLADLPDGKGGKVGDARIDEVPEWPTTLQENEGDQPLPVTGAMFQKGKVGGLIALWVMIPNADESASYFTGDGGAVFAFSEAMEEEGNDDVLQAISVSSGDESVERLGCSSLLKYKAM